MTNSSELFRFLDEKETWFRLYKFTCSLEPDESYMLSYLIDASRHIQIGLADDPDFFLCSMKGFIGSLLTGWSEYQVRTAITKLVNKGFIYKRTINVDGKNSTYIKLNADKISELSDSYDEERLKNRLQSKLVQR